MSLDQDRLIEGKKKSSARTKVNAKIDFPKKKVYGAHTYELHDVFYGKNAASKAGGERTRLAMLGYATLQAFDDSVYGFAVYKVKTPEMMKRAELARTWLIGVDKERKYKDGTYRLHGKKLNWGSEHGFGDRYHGFTKAEAEAIKNQLKHKGWSASQIRIVRVRNDYNQQMYALYIWGNMTKTHLDTNPPIYPLFRKSSSYTL